MINYHVEKFGDVASIKVVDLDDDVIIISQDGIIIRIAAESIRLCSRPSKGVTVMKVSEGDKVVTLARAPHEEDEDIPKETEENPDDNSTENTPNDPEIITEDKEEN